MAAKKTAETEKKTASNAEMKKKPQEEKGKGAEQLTLELREQREKKQKLKLSILAYVIGVCAVLVAVLFIAKWTGSDAWFIFLPRFLMGQFSWAAVSVPVLMIYGAYYLPQIVREKKHIWNLILAAWLLVNVSVMLGLILDSDKTGYGLKAVYEAGKAGKGGGIFGSYIAFLLKKLVTKAGAWVIVIAIAVAQTVFLIGLTLEDAGHFAMNALRKLWGKIKGLFGKNKKSGKDDKKKQVKKAEEEDEDEEFIPPPPPKEGTKYYHKPMTDQNPYAEPENGNGKKTAEKSGAQDSAAKRTGLFAEDDEDDEITALPAPEVIKRPAPSGWGEGAQSQVPGKRESAETKKSGKRDDGVDLDDIFNGTGGKHNSGLPIIEMLGEEDGDEPDEDVLPAAVIPAKDANKPISGDGTKRAARMAAVTDEQPEEKKEYVFPPISLLTAIPSRRTDVTDEQRENARKLVDTLRSFKVRTKIVDVCSGPTITRYELQPEEGVRVRAIANLVDDISLSLATSGVRIEAPIPGKAAVGVEVPNKERETVYLRTLLDDRRFEQAQPKLTAAIGVDVAGAPIYVDLSKMPHLLIAGTTGSGKSVCLNCLILSILYKATPDEVKLIMIDPKKVEFNVYNGLPHLIIPVVSNAKKAAGALAWAVNEMERRYELIEMAGVRDIKNYNKVTADDPEKEYMPQLVIIIDELADLMMTAPGEVEESICRIAQKGRACGMHLIIGTQRPSVDVITGLIKANVPSRIAFTVSSQVDSRTIIDIAGAEKLIGRGDMLYAPIGAMKPARLQGPFVSDEEVEAVTNFIIDHSEEAVYDDKVMKDIEKEAELCGNKGKKSSGSEVDLSDESGESDPMLKAAIDLAVESGKISTSLIQRRLSLGYGRAAKLIDEMEQRGIVSPPEGQKPRTVLISSSEWNEMCMRAEDR